MRKPLAWLNQQRRSGRLLFDPKRATELLDLIPTGEQLARAGALFLAAEEEPAPEAWLHVAIGVMLESEPSAVNLPDAYRCAIADGAYRDPAVWERYEEPGFSAAVIVSAIREARLAGALPSPGAFLKLCIKHRRQFKICSEEVGVLMETRWSVEDAVEKLHPQLALTQANDDWDDDPF